MAKDKETKEATEYDLTTRELKALEVAVTRAMQEVDGGPLAKWLEGRKIRKTKQKEKKQKIRTQLGRTTIGGEALRFLGRDNAALWYDRFFGTPSKAKTAEKKLVDKQKKEKKPETETKRQISYQSGTLVVITRQLNSMSNAMLDIAVDVTDIKSLLSPRNINAKGRKGTGGEGQFQAVRYDPLAPTGEQFRQVSEGGKTTGARMSDDFKMSAIMQAATQASRLVRKEEEREKEKGELREKYKFQDVEEADVFSDDPITKLRVEMNEGFAKIFRFIDDSKSSRSGGIGGAIMNGLMGVFKSLKFIPFLKILGGGAVALAGWLGHALGTWLNEKFEISTKIVDAIFAVKEWWAELDLKGAIANWSETIREKVNEWGLNLKMMVVNAIPDMLPGVKEWKQKFYAENGIDPEQVAAENLDSKIELEDRFGRLVDRGLSFFGNDAAQQRLDTHSAASSATESTTPPPAPTSAPASSGGPGAFARHEVVVGDGSGRADVEKAMDEFGITGKHRASLLAQVDHESNGFKRLEENMNYSAERLLQVFPKYFKSLEEAKHYQRQPKKIANKVYGGRMGNSGGDDGWKYRGRGFIQLTGKNNYKQFGDMIGVDLVGNPDAAANPKIAAKIAAAYYKSRIVDKGIEADDLVGVTKAVQGGSLGIEHRGELMAKYSAPAAPASGDEGWEQEIIESLRPVAMPNSGNYTDRQSRDLQTGQATAAVSAVHTQQPVVMHSTQPIMTPAGRPLERASAFNRDGSLIMAANRDAWHPAG